MRVRERIGRCEHVAVEVDAVRLPGELLARSRSGDVERRVQRDLLEAGRLAVEHARCRARDNDRGRLEFPDCLHE